MRYLMMFVGEEEAGEAEQAKVMQQVGGWWEKYSQSGAIVGGERLKPSSSATTVRFGGSAPSISDGPFAETKESIAGYAVVQVPDLNAALEMAKSWPASPVVEIRPIWED
ncbi:MAG TPA: YciI family protein [Candidatus Dormibacteraeota bacterium]